MTYVFARGTEQKAYEISRKPSGSGYALTITDGVKQNHESFHELADLLAREHQLRTAWKAEGWRETTTYPAKGHRSSPGPKLTPLSSRFTKRG